jgi:hypothetical protein
MKKNIILILSLALLLCVELYLVFFVGQNSETFVMEYEFTDFLYLTVFISFLFTKENRLGLLFVSAYQIVIGLIYYSHLPENGNLILMILHLTIAPVIYFHNWIENRIGIK